MPISILLHTENKEKLIEFFKYFNQNFKKTDFSLVLHAKNYTPWIDEELKKEITSFQTFYAFPTSKTKTQSVVEMLLKTKTDEVIIIDEENPKFKLIKEDTNYSNFVYTDTKKILQKNLDTNYSSIKWFIIDLLSQIRKTKIEYSDNSSDGSRYTEKILDPRFFEKIIYVDGGLGDHVMALPILEKLEDEIYICCKYNFLYNHLNVRGFIHWGDKLFGGYSRFVYEYGSTNNSKTIIDAFFGMYGLDRDKEDVLKYNGIKKEVSGLGDKKIALICSSAAKIQGLESNKDWKEVRWLKLVNELQKQNYFVIQVGSKNDNQIPRVNMKFLDQPIENLAYLIDKCSLWISVDTFFHHFASSINPTVGVCLTPYYNDHAKHDGVTYIEKDCGKNYSDRRWWMDLQQPERKECMDLINIEDVLEKTKKTNKISIPKTRFEIINYLIETYNYKSYLEIGVYNPDGCFNKINCDYKVSVDPMVEGDFPVMFKMTSDDFFTQNTEKFDLIFIDGLHIDEQVQKDIYNSFNSLNENGIIVLHDCNPPTHYHARENYYDTSTPVGWDWNGTVWRAIVKERCNNPNIFTSVIDTDWGVGIMQKSKHPNQIENLNPDFIFEKFAENRKYYLNLITPEEFIETYTNEKKNMVIVQIGSNKGNDKLTEYIKNNDVNLDLGLFVEPITFHIEELKKCYESFPNAIIENVAIKLPNDQNKKMKIYYHVDDGPKYEVASCDKGHILKHYKTDKINSIDVDSITLEELLDKYNLKKIDWLLIDAEGMDASIIETFNWGKYDINRIDVEHIHWDEKRESIFNKFYDMKYKHVVANDDRYDVAFEKN